MGSNGAGNTYRLRPIIAFQSTSPCGEQRGKDATGGPSPEISIHIPVWGATSSSLPTLPGVTDFNPHPRVGSNQQRRGRGPQQRAISIHIPVWGATQWAIGGPRGPHTPDFNPHPRVGSNSCRTSGLRHVPDFNPHPRVGSNPPRPCSIVGSFRISIHIPVWGATPDAGQLRSMAAGYFNPHPRVGSNRDGSSGGAGVLISIHIPVWGATWCHNIVQKGVRFQSTSPCGEQPDVTPYHPATYRISIHIPVWGATGLAFPSS